MNYFTILKVVIAVAISYASIIAAVAQEPTDSIVSATEHPDSTRTSTELEEVVIEGRTRKAIDNGFLVIPSDNDKKFSSNAYQLLENIRMPGLRVEGSQVENVMGQGVALFINYERCTDFEARSLQTKDVLRVEYLEGPNDPRFGNSPFVVNFIVKEYVYGGYTSLSASSNVDRLYGSLLLASKFAYKKTTTNLFVNYDFLDDSKRGSKSDEVFHNIDFNGIHYDEITRKTDQNGKEKYRTLNAALIIRNQLRGSNMMRHTISFYKKRIPSQQYGSVFFTPEISTAQSSASISSYRELSPYISGYYFFDLNSNFLNISWSTRYQENKNWSNIKQGGLPDIVNNTDEKAFQGAADVTYLRHIGNNTIQAVVSTDLTRFKTRYFGDTNSIQRLFRTSNDFYLNYWRQFSQTTMLMVRLGANLFTSKFNDLDTEQSWTPNVQAYLAWTLNQNHRMSFLAGYSFSRVPNGYLADVEVQRDPLIWEKGNPDLKNQSTTYFQYSYTWIPNDKFNLSVSPSLSLVRNDWAVSWTSNPAGGICKNHLNLNYFDTFDFPIDLSWRPCNLLGFTGRIVYFHQWMKGEHKKYFNFVEGNINATVYLRKFSISAYAISPYTRQYYDNKEYGYWQWGLEASYTTGNLLCSVRVSNPFLTEDMKYREYSTPHYSGITWRSWSRRSISVSLTYTLNYGKKIDYDGPNYNNYGMGTSVLGGKQD